MILPMPKPILLWCQRIGNYGEEMDEKDGLTNVTSALDRHTIVLGLSRLRNTLIVERVSRRRYFNRSAVPGLRPNRRSQQRLVSVPRTTVACAVLRETALLGLFQLSILLRRIG
jgi:hypothetical protein